MNHRFDNRYDDVSWPGWNRSFDRDRQLALCAGQLDILREMLGEQWLLIGKSRLRKTGLAEAKVLAKHVIRLASESVDFYATVDFITHEAYDRLDEMRRANGDRSLTGHLKNWDRLTHEHMVPCSAVLQAMTALHSGEAILPVLEALSFRALVSGTKRRNGDGGETDAYLLDVKFGMKSSLPEVSGTSLFERGFRKLDEVPFRFWPLMRYEAAGLLHKLIPVTERAGSLLADYSSAP